LGFSVGVGAGSNAETAAVGVGDADGTSAETAAVGVGDPDGTRADTAAVGVGAPPVSGVGMRGSADVGPVSVETHAAKLRMSAAHARRNRGTVAKRRWRVGRCIGL
jgi:hypothetical protein